MSARPNLGMRERGEEALRQAAARGERGKTPSLLTMLGHDAVLAANYIDELESWLGAWRHWSEKAALEEKSEDHTLISDETLARIARDLRCDAPAPGDLDIFCGCRLGHNGPHVGLSLDGDSCEWKRSPAA